MSAMLIKSRARKPLSRENVNAGWYPLGVGGMVHNGPCICLTIGEHRLFIDELAWQKLVESSAKLMAENPAMG